MTLQEVHQPSIYRRAEIVQSELCGYFYCLHIFPPTKIESWVDDGQIALCPYGGIDSMLGSAPGIEASGDFLSQLRERYF